MLPTLRAACAFPIHYLVVRWPDAILAQRSAVAFVRHLTIVFVAPGHFFLFSLFACGDRLGVFIGIGDGMCRAVRRWHGGMV